MVSATSWRLFRVKKPVSDRIALSRHVVIVLAGSRQVRCIFDVLARWTLENDQTYDVFDTSLIQYLLILCYDTVCASSIKSFFRAINCYCY